MRLFAPFSSPDLAFWGAEARLEPPVVVSGLQVIHGKRVGRELGIPTANLNVAQDLMAAHGLLPGIYLGLIAVNRMSNPALADCEHRPFPALFSFGYNPQYNQQTIQLEALICHDFGGAEFYDSTVDAVLESLLRPEARFASLDDFVHALQCDVAQFSKFG